MTKSATTDTNGRMGRPPLNVKETKIRLTDEQRARIEARVGTYGMSKWIREAIEEKLAREDASKA